MHEHFSPPSSISPGPLSTLNDTVMDSRVSLHSKVEARKQCERDAQLLANRIKLLQQEEEKALRSVELAKQKAIRLASVKYDAALREAEVLDADRAREEEKVAAKERNAYLREIEKASRLNSKQQLEQQNRRAAIESRIALRASVERKVNEEASEKQKILLRTEAIRQDRMHSRLRKEKIQMNRLLACKTDHAKRIAQEEQLAQDSEALLSKLEKKELELIQRLQKAQELQSKITHEVPPVSSRRLPPRVATPVSLTRRDVGGPAMR